MQVEEMNRQGCRSENRSVVVKGQTQATDPRAVTAIRICDGRSLWQSFALSSQVIISLNMR